MLGDGPGSGMLSPLVRNITIFHKSVVRLLRFKNGSAFRHPIP